MIEVIAFDADDTLWHNETLFVTTKDRFLRLLEPYVGASLTEQKLDATELRNLSYFGYGIKGFALSMIETAIELTNGRISGTDIQTIIDFTKDMLGSPVELLEEVEEVVAALAADYPLMLITKGDLFDQEAKLAKSGIGRHFSHVEIVSDKTSASYTALLARHKIDPAHFLMVGNSLRSDILPVIAVGGKAVHIPYHMTWAHELVTLDHTQPVDYFELEHIRQLPALVAKLRAREQ